MYLYCKLIVNKVVYQFRPCTYYTSCIDGYYQLDYCDNRKSCEISLEALLYCVHAQYNKVSNEISHCHSKQNLYANCLCQFNFQLDASQRNAFRDVFMCLLNP